MPIQSEESGIESLRNGGVAELARLIDFERDRLKKMVAFRLGRRITARVDASDIVQETFVAASTRLDRYLADPAVPPFVWLRSITLDVISRTRRFHLRECRNAFQDEREIADDSANLLLEEIAISMPSPRSLVAGEEARAQVRLLLAEMSERDRSILSLKFIEGLSFREAAAELEIAYEAVRKRFMRALIRFRRVYERAASE